MSCKSVFFSLLILATASFSSATSSAFIWSNSKSLTSSALSLQEVQESDAVLSLLLAASGKGVFSPLYHSLEPADYVIAYLGKQADSRIFPQPDFQAGPLQPVLNSAESWLSFQYANTYGVSDKDSIQQALVEADVESKVFGCDGSASDLPAIEAVKQYIDNKGEARVLLICSGGEDAAAEAAEVLSLSQALEDVQSKYVAAYAAESPAARILTETSASALPCGDLCQAQVAWLQCILAAGVLLIALLSGLSCLYLLDTPTKFEVPKEGAGASS